MKRVRYSPGSVLMEFLVVCPLMGIFMAMILQFAQIWMARQITAYAAYCATRAAIVARTDDEAAHGAQKAAELACAWMCLAGVPGSSASAGGTTETVELPRFHDRDDISTTETVVFDDGAPKLGEIRIPGWGTIPGSDSASIRVETEVLQRGYPVAQVKVTFKFPALIPFAGKYISWAVNSDAEELSDKYEHGAETVLDASGDAEERTYAAYGEDGKFPFITLTEYGIIPMPYSTRRMVSGAFADDLPKGGGI